MIKSIVIVGGGTAGWITAATIAARHKTDSPQAIRITVVESPNIPTIGVGEGSWPSLVNTISRLGISEGEFVKSCDVSFKQGIKFEGWSTGEEDDYYLHPFSNPHGPTQFNLVPHWIKNNKNFSFADSVTAQSHLCLNHKAPKQLNNPEFKSVENYGYHLDAGKFSEFLKKHCKSKLGVRHIKDTIEKVVGFSHSECEAAGEVDGKKNGDIDYLVGKNTPKIEADLFIDCSGSNGLLINKFFKVPFQSKKHILFADTALAVQIPYREADAPIQSMTRSVAQSAGWIWDIGLPNRRGIGHVYSSHHIKQITAEEELRNYLRNDVDDVDALSFRKIDFEPGHREKFWVKNCVAVGMSAGFLEPLEASAIGMIELSARMIAEHLPATHRTMKTVANNFNRIFLQRWDMIIDFLKMHYSLSKRTDSQFWIDNTSSNSIPESLSSLLEFWHDQSPSNNGFMSPYDMFPVVSYQYVLYGMGFQTNPNLHRTSSQEISFAKKLFEEVKQKTKHLQKDLPSNRELINHIYKHGMLKR